MKIDLGLLLAVLLSILALLAAGLYIKSERPKLADSLEQSNEPVVLVFLGDHMPNLGEDYLAYKELGYIINQTGSIEDIAT